MNRLVPIALAVALCAAPAAAQYVSDAEAFITAVAAGDGDKTQELVDKSPTIVNKHNSKGKTALAIVIAREDETWTRFFLAKGADPNLAQRDEYGDTPLIAAARVGFTAAADWLLAKGARIDGTNRMGETALIIAVQQRDLPMAKLLLEKGANADKVDHAQGFSARDYAKRDARARDILTAIDAATERKKPKDEKKLDDFKL